LKDYLKTNNSRSGKDIGHSEIKENPDTKRRAWERILPHVTPIEPHAEETT
jgi:hypothetical protein